MESDQLHEINYILTCERYAVKDINHADELQWKWSCEKEYLQVKIWVILYLIMMLVFSAN